MQHYCNFELKDLQLFNSNKVTVIEVYNKRIITP